MTKKSSPKRPNRRWQPPFRNNRSAFPNLPPTRLRSRPAQWDGKILASVGRDRNCPQITRPARDSRHRPCSPPNGRYARQTCEKNQSRGTASNSRSALGELNSVPHSEQTKSHFAV